MLASLHRHPIFSTELVTAWKIILVIVIGDIMVRKKFGLDKFPVFLQFAIYTFGLMKLLSVWIDLYVPHPFVYNKF